MPAIVEHHPGAQNQRFVVELDDGARVESVVYRGDTVCVSTQVGCAVACPFCASGAHGLERNLTPEELRAQVELCEQQGFALDKVTLSGVGEPLHNLGAVESFVGWCRERDLRPSLTTSGGPVRHLRRALSLHHNGITISVHAGAEATRARLVPRGPSLDALFATLRDAVPTLSRSRRRKIALAYLLVRGDNDGDDEIEAFLERSKDLELPIHLYALNPVPTSGARSVDRHRYEAIYERMVAAGSTVRMSSSARVEATGGCGTLVATPRLHRSRS